MQEFSEIDLVFIDFRVSAVIEATEAIAFCASSSTEIGAQSGGQDKRSCLLADVALPPLQRLVEGDSFELIPHFCNVGLHNLEKETLHVIASLHVNRIILSSTNRPYFKCLVRTIAIRGRPEVFDLHTREPGHSS